jgi:DNA primase
MESYPVADFAAIKEKLTIEQAAQMLGLQVKQQGAQKRGKCPACATGGDRALVITPAKQLFYCFSAGIGGDLISLVGHIEKCSLADAGKHLADHFGIGNTHSPKPTAPPEQKREPTRHQFDPEAYATRLDASHPALEALGLAPDTLREFRAGYATTGVNRGRLAVAVADKDGNILGFVGRALKDEQPALIAPNGLDLRSVIFNVHRADGEVRMVRDILGVLQAHELGETAICFLTELIEPGQHEHLASLQDQKGFKVFY